MQDRKCPDLRELEDYVSGRLDDATSEDFADHIDECELCQGLLETMDDPKDTLVESLRGVPKENPYEQEPGYRQALEKAKAGVVLRQASSIELKTQPLESLDILGEQDDFELLAKLGEGGMGEVYKARNRRLGKLVALKILTQGRAENKQAIARFGREMRAMGQLKHPNVVEAYDAPEINGRSVLVMEYVDGIDLSKVVDQLGPLSVADACEIARQTARGLQHVNNLGQVHRDIKPSNLMIAAPRAHGDGEVGDEGDSPHVKILDLGLARVESQDAQSSEMTSEGQAMGTADYMAPEQAGDAHKADIRADVYSLGCTLYKLLTGHAPFSDPKYDNRFKKMTAHVREPIPPLEDHRDDLPAGLLTVLARMTAKEPADRLETPAEVADALGEFCTGSDLTGLVARARQAAASSKKTGPDSSTEEYLSSALLGTEASAAPLPAHVRTPAGRSWKRWTIVAAVMLLATCAVITWQVIIYIQRPEGTLVVQIDDPAVKTRIDEGGIEIEDTKTGSTYTIKPGERKLPTGKYLLSIRDDAGLQVDTPEFTLSQGRKVTVRVTFKETVSFPEVEPSSAAVESNNELAGPREPITIGPPVKVEPVPIHIEPEPRDIKPGQPMSEMALVSEPATIEGIRSWTIETIGHRDDASSARYHPDGTILASAGCDGSIRLWDMETKTLVRTFVGHDRSVGSLSWSPTGQHLASASEDNTVKIWDAVSGQLVSVLPGHWRAVAWSPNGRILATGFVSPGHAPRNRLWDMASGRQLFEFKAGCYALVWSHDGKLLASGDDHGSIRLTDIMTGKELRAIAAGEDAIVGLTWSPDDRYLAVLDDARILRFWNRQTNQWLISEERLIVTGGKKLSWSPRDSRIAIHCPQMWDSRTMTMLWSRHVSEGKDVDWSPDARMIAIAGNDGVVRIWSSQRGEMLAETPGHFIDYGEGRAAAWSPDGKIVAASGPAREIGLYAVGPGNLVETLKPRVGSLNRIVWSPSGRTLALGANLSSVVSVFDLETRSVKCRFDVGDADIDTIAWSPDGGTLAVSRTDATRIFSLTDGELVRRLEAAKPAAWSADGKLFFAGGKVFDASNYESISTLDVTDVGRLGEVASFSPDGGLIAVREGDSFSIYETRSGRRSLMEKFPFAKNLIWSHDGKQLIATSTHSSSLQTTVFDVATGVGIRHARARQRGGFSDAVSPAGHAMAVRTPWGTLECWETVTGRRLGTCVPMEDAQYLIVSPDGHYRGTPNIERHIVYVAETNVGEQLTLTPEEFGRRFGWWNDSDKVWFGVVPPTQAADGGGNQEETPGTLTPPGSERKTPDRAGSSPTPAAPS